MKPYIIALFGHRDFYEHNKVEEALCPIIEELIGKNPYVEIYIGRNGEFDIFAASVIKQMQKRLQISNFELTAVLPYNMKDVEFFEKYYDSVFIPESVEKIHPKGAIRKRNEWMIQESDLCIFYVNNDKGGAFTALKYAKKLGKPIINLAK